MFVLVAAALLMASAGCTCNQECEKSTGPHQHTAADGKEMRVGSPGPHQ